MSATIERVLNRSGRALGLEISRIPKGTAAVLKRNSVDDLHTKAILASLLRRDSCCVDVGAHAGTMIETVLRIAPEGQHVAFEPLPEYAARLRQQFPSVDVRQAALGDRSGSAEFTFVPGQPALSGLASTARQSYERQLIAVEIMTLDEALPDARIDVLKVDVEGAELHVLAGGRATLERTRPVIFFEHQRLRYDKGFLVALGELDYELNTNLFTLLADDLGYRLFDLDGIGPLTAAQFRRLYETAERFNFLASPRP